MPKYFIEQKNEKIKIVEDYDVDNVSVKVLRIILSYTEYINNTVWKNFSANQSLVLGLLMLGHKWLGDLCKIKKI